jgi:hypothetical protein
MNTGIAKAPEYEIVNVEPWNLALGTWSLFEI